MEGMSLLHTLHPLLPSPHLLSSPPHFPLSHDMPAVFPCAFKTKVPSFN